MICRRCKQQVSDEWLKYLSGIKGMKIRKSLATRRRLGEPIGRPRAASYDKINHMRKLGYTMQKISDILYCSIGTVQRAIKSDSKGESVK